LFSGVGWAKFSEIPARDYAEERGRVGMSGVNLKGEWDHLDSETRQWLLDNPGCLILPRAMSARVCARSAEPVECDQHGQIELSREDLDFIREKAEAVGTMRAPGRRGYLLFGAEDPDGSGSRW
jgi:hypothetical protein